MHVQRTPAQLSEPRAPASNSSLRTMSSGWSLRKLFGFGSKEEAEPDHHHYPSEVRNLTLIVPAILFCE